MNLPRFALTLFTAVGVFHIAAVSASETQPRAAAELVATLCAACHHSTLTGGAGPNLLDQFWNHGGDPKSIAQSIRDGWWLSRMPPFKAVLTEPEIQGVVAYIQEQGLEFAAGRVTFPPPPLDRTIESELETFRIETIATALEVPWGITFLSNERILVSERPGRLRIIDRGKLQPEPIADTPSVFFRQDGGMLDVIAHPDYANNRWIYLAFSEQGTEPNTSGTVVVRGRIRENRWVDQQAIFRGPPNVDHQGYVHYGCRFLFDSEGHLFFTIGDRGHANEAQDLSSSLGKIHRVREDGSVPRDNPFVDRDGALGSIWSYGHRHPQGVTWHPVSGELWASEHGPRGGDELNRIEHGRNYGWPVISEGTDRFIDIRGRVRKGMERPVISWTPAIAPSAIEYYAGDRFPRWKNHLFVAALLGDHLLRLEIEGGEVVRQEIVFQGLGRVRDVTTGPDGLLYVSLEGPGRIVRLVPAETAAP